MSIHLVMQLGTDPIGLLTRKVHAPFGAWINRRRGGLGTILAERPKSVLVHSDMYGLELIRYVHNNPVRAGVVSRASESNWSSHGAYLGLAECPSWLATEAVFGPDETKREEIRRDLAEFVDEGREETRRSEFSGEVSRELTRRIRGLLGGEVELSYPILGPDEFVVSAIKQQVTKHRNKERSRRSEAEPVDVIVAVFECLGIAPDLAWKRVKPSNVARGRALAAWLWVETMGRPQVMIADAMSVRRAAVSKMLSHFRRNGLSNEDRAVLAEVFERLTGDVPASPAGLNAAESGEERPEPKVLVLKRNRNK
jgi:hypothetical protein